MSLTVTNFSLTNHSFKWF